MSEQLPLGKIITDEKYHHGYRDAVHVAVVPMTAAHKLLPGTHVGLIDDRSAAGTVGKRVGIVDPFLARPVGVGERFWLFLYPGTIKSLRHHWQHDDVPEPPGDPGPLIPEVPNAQMVKEAEQSLQYKAEQLGLSYHKLMTALDEYHKGTLSWLTVDESDAYQSDEQMERLWTWWGIVRGTHHDPNDRGNFFSCSC